MKDCKSKNLTVLGMGASTKGNVLLQHAKIGPDLLPAIAEVNENKFGCLTPATNIPIISESEAASRSPFAYVVLPWHFKDNFCLRQKDYLSKGGKLVFPLPHFQIVENSI